MSSSSSRASQFGASRAIATSRRAKATRTKRTRSRQQGADVPAAVFALPNQQTAVIVLHHPNLPLPVCRGPRHCAHPRFSGRGALEQHEYPGKLAGSTPHLQAPRRRCLQRAPGCPCASPAATVPAERTAALCKPLLESGKLSSWGKKTFFFRPAAAGGLQTEARRA